MADKGKGYATDDELNKAHRNGTAEQVDGDATGVSDRASVESTDDSDTNADVAEDTEE